MAEHVVNEFDRRVAYWEKLRLEAALSLGVACARLDELKRERERSEQPTVEFPKVVL